MACGQVTIDYGRTALWSFDMSKRNLEFRDALKQIWYSIRGQENKASLDLVKDELLLELEERGLLSRRNLDAGSNPLDYWDRGNVPPDKAIVDFLAEVGIQRAKLDGKWLDRFLRSAGYSQQLRQERAAALLQYSDRLLPHRPFELRSRHGEFLGRRTELEMLLDTLQSNWHVCLIQGLGGIGKTTIALEAAYACAGQPRGMAVDLSWPTFDYMLWTFDEGGRLTLDDLLDAIAHRLGYPRLTKLALDDKRREVRDILSEQTVLLIIDNFETVRDLGISEFVTHLPPSVRVLLTSREDENLLAPIFQRLRPARIHVGGLPETEALTFLHQEARRLASLRPKSERARLEAVTSSDEATLLTLVKATDGNPKALALALGYIADSATPLELLVHNLYAAHDSVAKLLHYFFSQAWERCSEEARSLWRAVSFFADAAGREALTASANLRGRYFYDALEQLRDRSLLDVEEGLNGEPRYRVHPMVRAYALARLREAPDLEAEARQHWIEYFDRYVSDNRNEDWSTFAALDHEYENVIVALQWALERTHSSAPFMVRHFWRYLYVRGHWRQAELLLRQALQQVTADGDFLPKLWFTSTLGWMLAERGQYGDALQHLHQVEAAVANLGQQDLLASRDVFNFLGQTYIGLNALDQAESHERRFLELAEQAGQRRDALVARYYLAWIQALNGAFEEAESIFRNLVMEARDIHWQRAEGYCMHRLALTLIHAGRLEEVEEWLTQVEEKAAYWQEPLLQAHALFDRAQFEVAQGGEKSKEDNAASDWIAATRTNLVRGGKSGEDEDDKAKQLGLAALDLYQRLEAESEIKTVQAFLNKL